MASFHLRFVGATDLPKSLSQFDVDQSFRLGLEDIEAVLARFRADQRLGAALQLVFIRATGRSLERVAGIPKALLKSLCSALGVNETAIASLKTLYQRRSTLYEHRKWAVEASGLSSVDDSALVQLQAALCELASIAASVDDLVKEAELWLFHRRHLLPGDRVLRDASRVAFSSIEAAAVAAVRTQVGAPRKLLAALYGKRRGRVGGTVLEWLKTPPAKHGPAGLNEATEKIALLKSHGVDGWTLGAISNARLRAYSQAVVNRPVSETKKLSDETQLLEVACFLRATLLDLTDSAIYMAGRRVCDLTRHATARVQVTQARSAYELRERHEQIRLVLYAEGRVPDSFNSAQPLPHFRHRRLFLGLCFVARSRSATTRGCAPASSFAQRADRRLSGGVSICRKRTRHEDEACMQVVVVPQVSGYERVNLSERYDYPKKKAQPP
jgi:hypothetical protein